MYNSDKKKRGHAISLFSGGLDSILAIILIQRQDIEVTAITFMTHFGCDLEDRSGCGSNPYPMAEKFGFNVKLMHLGQKFIDIVRKPRYGYGKNMNPCIDCRLLMLAEARQFMELVNADFVITGEVVGQRPKSQQRNIMNMVAHRSGLNGRLVRPLSAHLLAETEPEKSGLLDRNLLERIAGRSRRRQMELAREFDVTDYPQSAGGCLLTDPTYSKRLKDLLKFNENFDFDDLNLLRHGRHFRIDEKTKIIVGRNQKDNEKISGLIKGNHIVLEARNTGSPITILTGESTLEKIKIAAELTARYCDAKNDLEIPITVTQNYIDTILSVESADLEIIERFQIK